MKQNALVTGGSRGIGRAVCYKLAEMGCHILINYRSNEDAAKETLQGVEQRGGSGELLPFDVADGQAATTAIEKWQQDNSEEYISILVNNAGVRQDNMLMWMNDEEWENVIDTSLNGFFFSTRTLIKQMLTKRFGRIINIVSLSGINGMPGQVNYSAAKAGVIGATKALAQEVAKKKVTVNAVAPGFIKTDMTQDLDEKDYKSVIPMQRFGEPEEIADLVGFLASEQSSYITGEVISVSGGLAT